MDDSHFPTRTQEPYANLLKRKEWLIKKAHIIARDRSRCCNCGKEGASVPLEVHHKYYMQGLDPWEYPDEVLTTLCAECHHKWHQNNQIRYAEKKGYTWYWTKRIPCLRCNGVGYLHEYRYYKDGICFRCWGERFEKAEQRVKIFTEQYGKTPYEYFDVFVPLTDEDFVRLNVELDGNIGNVSFLVGAGIRIEKGTVFVDLVADNGMEFEALLDNSMIGAIDITTDYEQCLNIKTLLYKECMSSSNNKNVVIKGDIISYKEASIMAAKVSESHKHNNNLCLK